MGGEEEDRVVVDQAMSLLRYDRKAAIRALGRRPHPPEAELGSARGGRLRQFLRRAGEVEEFGGAS